MRRILKIAAALLLVLVVLVAVLVGRAVSLDSLQVDVAQIEHPDLDRNGAVERLSGAVRIPTISYDAAGPDPATLEEMTAYLEASFPRVHEAMQREIHGGSLLFTWTGADSSASPVVLTAHLDVVPPGDESLWTHPPFAGVVADGFIWGRGTLDDKIGVLGVLEAAEHLLAGGFTPPRTIYFAFGHDEEVGGKKGAAQMAALFAERSVAPEFVLDEGMVIMKDGLPGLDQAVALVGIAEKGSVTLKLTARADGGHSSMPPRGGAVARLARALDRLENQPLPTHFEGPAQQFFRYVAPEMPLKNRVGLANLWLLGPVVEGELAKAPGTDALIRTTTALTIVRGGVKSNVLPTEAEAQVNFRIHPSDSIAAVKAYVEEIVDDPTIEIEQSHSFGEPSPVSPTDGGAFSRIERTVREVFPETLVAPMLVLGATDAKHYVGLTSQVFRFAPMQIESADLKRVHGIDERIGIDAYLSAIAFYVRLLEQSGSNTSDSGG